MLPDERDVGLEAGAQPIVRRPSRVDVERLQQVMGRLAHHRHLQVAVAGEVVEDERFGHRRSPGDGVGREGVEALGGDDLEGGLQQLDAARLRLQASTRPGLLPGR